MRLMPTVVAFGVGGLDGMLRKHDISSGKTQLGKQMGTYVEFAEAALPFFADMFRLGLSREMVDSIGAAGAAMFGDRITRSGLISPAFTTGAPAAISGGAYVGAPYAARPMATPMGRPFAQRGDGSITVI